MLQVRVMTPAKLFLFILVGLYLKRSVLLKKLSYTPLILTFPKGTTFSVSVALSTFLPKDAVPEKVPNGFAQIIEYDFLYPLPNHLPINHIPQTTKSIAEKKKIKETPPLPIIYGPVPLEYFPHFAQGREADTDIFKDLLDEVKKFISLHNYNGTACVSRLSCEAQEYLQKGRSLLDDIVLAICTPQTQDLCDEYYKTCNISPLQILLNAVPIDGAS